MSRPLISVIIPAYNHEAYVGEAMRSVLRQSVDDFELIVVNDGSTDGTESVIQGFSDPRIKYYFQNNMGAHAAINRGMALAQGEYVAILNSDDAFHPERLSILLDHARQEEKSFLITGIQLIDSASTPVEDDDNGWIRWYEGLKASYPKSQSPAHAFLAGNYAITSSNFFFRADAGASIGLFRPYRYILDYDYAFRAARAFPDHFGFLSDQKLLNYRLHGHNTIAENPIKANIETFYFLKKAMIECFGHELAVPLQHLSKLKGYMVKIENAKRYKDIDRLLAELKSVYADRDGLHVHINGLYGQINTLHSNLAEQTALAALNASLVADVRQELAILKNSLSFRLGLKLTAPARWVRAKLPTRTRVLRKKVDSLVALQANLEKVIGQVKVVSFDIFDTLLERDIDPPDEVKRIVARKLARVLAEEYGVSCPERDLMMLRDRVEGDLRRKAHNGGMDHECKFSEIALGMAMELVEAEKREELSTRIVELELRVETEVLYVKRDIGHVLEWLNGRGVRVIAVSDMYLDQAHLQFIFESKGLHAHFDRIYVSSEVGMGKYSGRLFEHVLEQEGVRPDELIHIGDNHHSDYRSPARMGIHSLHFDDPESIRRRLTMKSYCRLAAQNPYWRGRHLMQMVRPAQSRGFHYDYGYTVLGPIYATFVLGVIDWVKKNGIREVYFLAREGELFMKLFQVLAPDFFDPEHLPTAHYLYVSRRSTSTASAYRGLAYEPAVVPLFNPKQEGLHSICNAFGLPSEEFAQVSRKHGYSSVKQPIYDWQSPQFRQMLEDPEFQRIVVAHASESWALLREYLDQHRFFDGGPVALVDIGWNGSIQKFFQEAFGAEGSYPHVHGLYLGFLGGIKHSYDESKNTLVGILCDERGKPRPQDVFSRFEEIFEEGARALHPTTIGYRKDDESGRVEPVLKQESALDRVAELRSNQRIAEFQAGILDFAPEFARALDLTAYTFEDIKPFVLTLAERAVAFPTSDEIHELMQLAHSEDFGYENVMDFRHEKFGGWHAIFRPRRLMRTLALANWKYGTAGSLGIPGINMVVRFYDLLKTK